MPLKPTVKKGLYKAIENLEGRIQHLYLDSKGKVTIGVGHLITNRSAIFSLTLYKTKGNLPSQMATVQEKQAEYEKIAKLPWGTRYGAHTFKQHTSLVMKDFDINQLLDKHISSFYKELTNIYNKTKGYPDDFDSLPDNVQLALFDMIFNLGATTLVNKFTKFNTALKISDWKTAAQEANRPEIAPDRNRYVKNLLLTTPAAVSAI